jgi:hypothetical protein
VSIKKSINPSPDPTLCGSFYALGLSFLKKKSINKEFKSYDGYVDIRENSVGQCKNQKINENTERNCE